MKIEWDYEEALKKIDELESKVSELENELSYEQERRYDAERDSRHYESRADDLQQEVYSLQNQLEEAWSRVSS